jgi:hypothetical protein
VTKYAHEVPPAYLRPLCADPVDAVAALRTGRTLLDAWQADREGLIACASQGAALWLWALTP